METFSALLALCEAGDLRRHRAHYDVTVMYLCDVQRCDRRAVVALVQKP